MGKNRERRSVPEERSSVFPAYTQDQRHVGEETRPTYTVTSIEKAVGEAVPTREQTEKLVEQQPLTKATSVGKVEYKKRPARLPLPPDCSGTLYEIQPGDTLFQLAQAHGLPLESLIGANPQIPSPADLTVGQMVCIPSPHGNIMEIINTALTAEKVEITLYAKGLVSPVLEGLPADQYAYFQAALDHEDAHRRALESSGASVPYTEFYYPPGCFEDREVFLNTILTIETAGVAAYAQAAIEFGRMGKWDLARLAERIMGVEAEHRTLIRSVLGLVPANNLCFEDAPDKPVAEILAAVPNFLSPNQFDGASVGPIPLPSDATIRELVGTNACPHPTP